jgi:hypothetical protein
VYGLSSDLYADASRSFAMCLEKAVVYLRLVVGLKGVVCVEDFCEGDVF